MPAGLAAVIAAALLWPGSGGAAFPGARGAIAFVRGGAIYSIDADGTHLQQLAPGENPAWSPDGSQIAFDRPGSGIFLMASDGSNVRQLTSDYGTAPAWEPDGKTILYVSSTPPPGTGCSPTAEYDVLWTIQSDGTGAAAFTPAGRADDICSVPGGDVAPAVSAHDGRVALVHREYIVHNEYDSGIVIASADGTHYQALRHGGGGVAPSWSPDGARIAFAGVVGRSPAIAVVRPDGRSLQRLTTFADGRSAPAWSPDGKTIVFARTTGKRRGLFLLGVKSHKIRRLTRGSDRTPDWQPVPG